MTDKPTTVKGKVAQINPWKSGKGFFLSFEGDENEYYKFGPCKYSVGQETCFECRPGSKMWSDKVEIVKEADAGTDTVDVNKLKQDHIESAKTVYLTKAEADAARQNSIERQSAIKSACALVSAIKPTTKTYDWDGVADSVMHVADKFLEFIQLGEPKLPDPEGAN